MPAKRAVAILLRCGPRRRPGRQRKAATSSPARCVGQQAATALHPTPSRSPPGPLTLRASITLAPVAAPPTSEASVPRCWLSQPVVIIHYLPPPVLLPSARRHHAHAHTHKTAFSCVRRSGAEAVGTTAHSCPATGAGGATGGQRRGGGLAGVPALVGSGPCCTSRLPARDYLARHTVAWWLEEVQGRPLHLSRQDC